MKLYDVPNGTLVKVLPQPIEEIVSAETGQAELDFTDPKEIRVPIAAPEILVDEYIHFGHIDGMYSFCQNMDGRVCHLAAWTEVEKVDWDYENMELLRTIMKRGGRGKDGNESLAWVTTNQMSDEWLANCITYEEEHRPDNPMIEFYEWEVKYREENEIKVTDASKN